MVNVSYNLDKKQPHANHAVLHSIIERKILLPCYDPCKFSTSNFFFSCTIIYYRNFLAVRLCFADVLINVPEELDLSHLRGRGLQPGEEELPEGEVPSEQPPQPPGYTSMKLSISLWFHLVM